MNQQNRRHFIKKMGGSAFAFSVFTQFSACDFDKKRPNILIIQPDQHRGSVMGCAGDINVNTPHLDQFAEEGIRFTKCFSASPVCSPFRGTMQTGLYCYQHGVVRNNIQMDTDLKTIAEYYVDSGYATGYIGKWHLDGGWPDPWPHGRKKGMPLNLGYVPPQNRQGWQDWLGYEKSHQYFNVAKINEQGKAVKIPGYDWEPEWMTDEALRFIRQKERENKPWMYYLAYGPPHLPNECPDRKSVV